MPFQSWLIMPRSMVLTSSLLLEVLIPQILLTYWKSHTMLESGVSTLTEQTASERTTQSHTEQSMGKL